jgi:hypothetical protein
MSIPWCCYPQHNPEPEAVKDFRVTFRIALGALKPRPRFRVCVKSLARDAWGKDFAAGAELFRASPLGGTREFFTIAARCATPARQTHSGYSRPRNFRAAIFVGVFARFLPPLWNAYPRIHTTTGRRFRHAEYKILWFLYEFFLTSFPQPPILRFQARGRISWPQRFMLPPTSRRAGPS